MWFLDFVRPAARSEGHGCVAHRTCGWADGIKSTTAHYSELACQDYLARAEHTNFQLESNRIDRQLLMTDC